jgi:gamma-D-glutamyl-L-lysine dipeptidyl-peptidase
MLSVITRAAVAPVLAGPSVRAEQVSQLVLGETAALVECDGEWRQICTDTDGYAGWVHGGYLIQVEGGRAEEWRSRARGWCEGADLQAGDTHRVLPLRARVELRNSFVVLPDGAQATVTRGAIQEFQIVSRTARAQPPERWALERFNGAPYQWGGVTPWGVDCSGLVQTTFAARGVALPRDSSQQVGCGEAVDLASIQPGDLLFFRGESGQAITHVAFAGEADTLVHATLACGGVVNEPWIPGTRAAGLRERLVAARRMEPR